MVSHAHMGGVTNGLTHSCGELVMVSNLCGGVTNGLTLMWGSY